MANILELQEVLLKDAGVPIPAEFNGQRKSYTLPADENRNSIGVLYLVSSCVISATSNYDFIK